MCVCSFSLFLIFCYHFISLHGKKFVNLNVFPNGLKKKKKKKSSIRVHAGIMS